MKKLLYLICVIIFCSSFVSYEKKGSSNMCCINNKMSNNVKVLFSTTMGDIEIKLFNETPGHRDNFIKNYYGDKDYLNYKTKGQDDYDQNSNGIK